MPRLPVAVVVAVLLLVAPARAFGQETLDQSYQPSGSTGDAIGALFAQTFTAGRAGKLTAVRLWGRPRNGSGLTVQITGLKADGSPDQVPLASARTGDVNPLVRFATPLWVVPGKKYAIVFDADDTWTFDWQPGDIYTRGEAWQCCNGGWSLSVPDFFFQTYVDVFPDTRPPETTIKLTTTPGDSGCAHGDPCGRRPRRPVGRGGVALLARSEGGPGLLLERLATLLGPHPGRRGRPCSATAIGSSTPPGTTPATSRRRTRPRCCGSTRSPR